MRRGYHQLHCSDAAESCKREMSAGQWILSFYPIFFELQLLSLALGFKYLLKDEIFFAKSQRGIFVVNLLHLVGITLFCVQ